MNRIEAEYRYAVDIPWATLDGRRGSTQYVVPYSLDGGRTWHADCVVGGYRVALAHGARGWSEVAYHGMGSTPEAAINDLVRRFSEAQAD